jgi:S-(hydroxymethyl)glutathione dehydrogenase/alcohol dehydrogenase
VQAAVVWEAGGPFVVHDNVVRREVGPGEVVVRVRAAGVCQTDISLSKGAFGQAMPVVLGHEGAGDVTEVGPGVASPVVGDRVVLTWVPSCGHCYQCVRGETYICANRRRSSERGLDGPVDLSVDGRPVQAGMGTATFAQETIVPANGVVPIADDIPFEYAALLGCAVPTGMGAALNSARVQPGETVLVVGCGAVGLSALQGAIVGGASNVVAVDPQESRRKVALGFGAAAAYAPDDEQFGSLVAGVGFDVGIDAVGRSGTIRATWNAVRRGGRVVVVGAGKADDLVTFSAQELFHEEKRLVGSFYGSSNMRREVPRMVALWRAGRLHLDRMVDDVVPLDRINEVVERQGTGAVVRVVVAP